MNAYLFFTTARWAGAKRTHRFLSATARTLSRSELIHISLGFDGAVLDVSINGARYWPMATYVDRFPTLQSVVRVPICDRGLLIAEMQSWDDFKPPCKIMPTFWRWASRGYLCPWPRDCLMATLGCLMVGTDLKPPYWQIFSPGQLYQYLITQGFAHESIDQADTRQRDTLRQFVAH